MPARQHSVSLQQATRESPVLAHLSDLARDSSARLDSILPLIPVALRGKLKAGPIDGTGWCLVLENTAAAAKLRQLLPALQAHLVRNGWAVESIRLKVSGDSSR